MSKKLVKTAKQQFEERLRKLGNHVAVEINGETFHSGIDKEKHFHILRIGDADIEYSEFDYGCTLLELYDNEEFLDKLAAEFAIGRSGIKPILEWWSDADKEHEPFDLSDIVKFAPVKTFFEFEDLYEEVPDVRIISAKEQWEKDSKGAEVVQKLANGSTYKVAVTDGSITFFVYQDEGEYFREVYPSFEELRKDVNFVMAYLSHVRATHDKDVDYALAWLQGGEYTMSKVSLLDIYEVGKCIDHLCYEDEEEPAENPVVKNEFKDEMDALREKMVQHIIELCDQGMFIDSDSFLKDAYSVTWANGSYYGCADMRCVYLRESVEYGFEFSYECKNDAKGDSSDCCIHELSIETLACIIKAMQ